MGGLEADVPQDRQMKAELEQDANGRSAEPLASIEPEHDQEQAKGELVPQQVH